MTKNKYWFVFGTHLGYIVSNNKMTLAEAQNLVDKARVNRNFFDTIGVSGGENWIFSHHCCSTWTRKDAENFAKERDSEMYSYFKNAVEDWMEDNDNG